MRQGPAPLPFHGPDGIIHSGYRDVKGVRLVLSQPAFRLAVVMLLAVLAAACDPVYKTNYIFTPPESEQGKICVNQCEQIKQSCY